MHVRELDDLPDSSILVASSLPIMVDTVSIFDAKYEGNKESV